MGETLPALTCGAIVEIDFGAMRCTLKHEHAGAHQSGLFFWELGSVPVREEVILKRREVAALELIAQHLGELVKHNSLPGFLKGPG